MAAKKNSLTSIIIKAVITLAMFAGVIYLLLHQAPIFVLLNGEQHMTIEVCSPYSEPGAIDRFSHQPITPEGKVDTSVIGDYRLVYRSGWQSLYRTVHVVDTTAPVLTVDQKYDIYCSLNGTLPDIAVTASDNYDTDIEDRIQISPVDTGTVGSYEMTFDVSDSSGNSAETVSVTVHVVDDDFHYLTEVKNRNKVSEEMLEVIIAYKDHYFQTMKYLCPSDPSELFAQDAKDKAWLSYKAFENLAVTRKSQLNDLSLDDCSYSITVKSVKKLANGITRVFVTEDSVLQFHFLNGLTSQQGLLWEYFYLKEEDGHYVLTDVFHEESFFLYLYNSYSGSGKEEIDQLSEQYVRVMEESRLRYEEDRKAVNDGATYTYLKAKHPYDRDKAVAYALKYGITRNKKYRAHESNCMNFVSQCLHAGGIPFDDNSSYQWKYYSKEHDEYTKGSGYSVSWTHIGYYQDYLNHKGKKGIVYEQDVNIYFGEGGDILYVDSKDRAMSRAPHVIIVADQVRDDNGDIIDLLVCGNTNDQLNYPLSAAGYPYKKLSKISGYN